MTAHGSTEGLNSVYLPVLFGSKHLVLPTAISSSSGIDIIRNLFASDSDDNTAQSGHSSARGDVLYQDAFAVLKRHMQLLDEEACANK